MEAMQQQSDKLVEEMLGFLESSDDEEEEEENENMNDDECQIVNAYCEKNGSSKEIMENATDSDTQQRKERKPKSNNTIAMELKKIQSQFPIWQHKDNNAPLSAEKKLPDPIWEGGYPLIGSKGSRFPIDDQETDWNSKLESNCRRSGNSYVQEVNRAIYGDTTGHPPYGSAEYFQMAQNYAIYGKDFLDFPEHLTPLLTDKPSSGDATTVTSYPACGTGLYPTPTTTPPDQTNGISFANFNKPSTTTTTAGAAGGASAAAVTSSYYQLCNGLQPAAVRPATGSTAYGMFLGNKVTYVAAAPTAPQLVYNQHSSSAANFISNSLANAALATSPAIIYSNPMLTTTTQQYLNTFLKETQYLSCGQAVGAAAATTGIYERLYAQMLQQQIYHQQAAAVAAMFQQHKTQRPQARATTNGGAAAGVVNSAMATALSGLNLCGRQAAMAAASHPTAVTTPVAVSTNGGIGGSDDSSPTSLGD